MPESGGWNERKGNSMNIVDDPDNNSVYLDLQGEVQDSLERARENLLNAEESAYREGLIAMGWTPPGGMADLLEEWAKVAVRRSRSGAREHDHLMKYARRLRREEGEQGGR